MCAYYTSDELEEMFDNYGHDPPDGSDFIPPGKLWVHPDLDIGAGDVTTTSNFVFTTSDSYAEWECPKPGCQDGYSIGSPLKYDEMEQVDYVIRCPVCDEPHIAVGGPPPADEYTTQGGSP